MVDQVEMSKYARGEKFDLILNSPLCKREYDVKCEKYDLLTAKATLPYEHLKNTGSLEEGFPSHIKFYSSLRGGNISVKNIGKCIIFTKKFIVKTWMIL